MALANGRKGTVNERDEDIFLDLYFATYLTTQQLIDMHFTTKSKARRRLEKLVEKGWLVTLVRSGTAFWKLTPEAWRRVAEHLGYPYGKEHYPSGDLLPRNALHHAETADLYARLKRKGSAGDRSRKSLLVIKTESGDKMTEAERAGLRLGEEEENLDDILGPYPNWEWRNEARAHRDLVEGNTTTAYAPDAEVRFGGDVFIIERQTRRSRPTEEEIVGKVASHKEYIEHILKKPNEAMILFACDTPRDAHYADRAREDLDVYLFAGNPHQVARYLIDRARIASESGVYA